MALAVTYKNTTIERIVNHSGTLGMKAPGRAQSAAQNGQTTPADNITSEMSF